MSDETGRNQPATLESLRERAAAMLERVTAECRVVLSDDDVAMIRHAVATALSARDRDIHDDHDPRYLHPARTVLILLSDAACRDADALAAAAFVESLPNDIEAQPSALSSRVSALVAAAAVPAYGDDLLERLVTAPAEATLIALAERLDHARHLHLMPDVPAAEFYAGIEAIYVPVAERMCPPIARRLRKWAGAFARRRLLDGHE